jgi:hypothetical protein
MTPCARAIVVAAALTALSSCRADRSATPQPSTNAGPTAQRAVASVDQVMDGIVIPASQKVFDAVVYVNGVMEQAPKTDEAWLDVQLQALAVAEAGNLLQMPPRAKDSGDWATFSRALTDSAYRVAQAAEAKNTDLVLSTGGEMYNACTGCHEKYLTMPTP